MVVTNIVGAVPQCDRTDNGSLHHLEFEGRYGEGLGIVPEAEALLVGDICQRDASLAPLQMHPN